MTTTTFTIMLIAFILLIVIISRIEGSPKMCANLLFALAFGVVVGIGIKSMKSSCTHSENNTNTELSQLDQQPMQALELFADVTAQVMTNNELAGQVISWSNEDEEELRLNYLIPDPLITIGKYAYEDSG